MSRKSAQELRNLQHHNDEVRRRMPEIDAHMARLRAGYTGGIDVSNPRGALKAALLEHARRHEELSSAVRRWTPAPPAPGERFEDGQRHEKAVDGSELVQYPPDHVARMQKQARTALLNAEGASSAALNKLVAEAAKDPATRLQQGTKLDVEHRGEVPLLVEEFRGRSRPEQADLIARAHAALARGDLQSALAIKRATEIIHISSAELDDALSKADPERQAAKAELDSIEHLVKAWDSDVARRHVHAGMAGDGERVQAVDFAAQAGFDQSDTGTSFVERIVGQ